MYRCSCPVASVRRGETDQAWEDLPARYRQLLDADMHSIWSVRELLGRGLHSSTLQLNLSRFCSQELQRWSTARLNLGRFCLCNLST